MVLQTLAGPFTSSYPLVCIQGHRVGPFVQCQTLGKTFEVPMDEGKDSRAEGRAIKHITWCGPGPAAKPLARRLKLVLFWPPYDAKKSGRGSH